MLAHALAMPPDPAAEISPHLRRVVARVIAEARAAGLDYDTQTRRAAHAVLDLRPHLTGGEALTLVHRVREQDAPEG